MDGAADIHAMELPRAVIVGERLGPVIAERVRATAGSRALMLTSPTPYKLLGKKVEEAAEKISFDVVILDSSSSVNEWLDSLENNIRSGYGAIIGIGGGRVLDVAKVVAEASNLPLFSIPTVASHDGIASPMTSIRKEGHAYSRKSVMPTEIIADMEVIRLAPMRYTISGCGDLVAKYSAVRDWWLGHRETGEYYGRYAAHLAYLSSVVVMRSAEVIGRGDADGIRTVVEALISAGVAMGIAGSSRPCSGSEHLIAHALEYLLDSPPLHGERCGIATIFTSYLHNANWRRVKQALKTMNAPSTLKELGIDEDVFTEAVKLAPNLRKERYTILHKLNLKDEEIRDILNDVGIS
ncbi:MAG: sn-glycerol-1-phosphate dehydrogenase [Aigarchaeota archaeon]|nr:sn-glycerol-1-phosphate dehydrogenase [Candidatus Pelearchaeum maunauluense]